MKNWFVSKGVYHAPDFSVVGKGESEPIADNGTPVLAGEFVFSPGVGVLFLPGAGHDAMACQGSGRIIRINLLRATSSRKTAVIPALIDWNAF